MEFDSHSCLPNLVINLPIIAVLPLKISCYTARGILQQLFLLCNDIYHHFMGCIIKLCLYIHSQCVWLSGWGIQLWFMHS